MAPGRGREKERRKERRCSVYGCDTSFISNSSSTAQRRRPHTHKHARKPAHTHTHTHTHKLRNMNAHTHAPRQFQPPLSPPPPPTHDFSSAPPHKPLLSLIHPAGCCPPQDERRLHPFLPLSLRCSRKKGPLSWPRERKSRSFLADLAGRSGGRGTGPALPRGKTLFVVAQRTLVDSGQQRRRFVAPSLTRKAFFSIAELCDDASMSVPFSVCLHLGRWPVTCAFCGSVRQRVCVHVCEYVCDCASVCFRAS